MRTIITMTVLVVFAFPAVSPAYADVGFRLDGHPGYSAPKRKRVHKHHGPSVKSWRFREPLPPLGPPPPMCMAPTLVSGVQGLTERGAEEKARDAWAAHVRTRLGERWMDLRFAKDFQKRCYRSSVGDNVLRSMSDKLKERVGMIGDQADLSDAMEFRCDVYAVPCEPPWLLRGEDVKKDVRIEGATQ